ncbi:MAG: CvpA family protein [Gammaproteobacteria bacterium]|nr:CvpA family protein [Gammaproteobacteria bacterium]
MTTADILILIVLLIPGLVGIMYGFLNLVFSFIAWLLAFGIAVKFGGYFSPLLANLTDTLVIRNMLAFAGLFIVSLMLLTTMGYFIVKLLGRTGLTAADRVLGFFLGIGLGGAIVTVIVFLAGFTALPQESWWQQSVLIEPFQNIALWGRQFLPDNVSKYHNYDITVVFVDIKGLS